MSSEGGDLPKYLRDHVARSRSAPRPPPVNGTAAPGEATAYSRAAFAGELAALQAMPQGERNHQLNKSAMALGQLCGAGHLPEAQTRDALYDMAISVGLEHAESVATIASGMRKGLSEPRGVPLREEVPEVTVIEPEAVEDLLPDLVILDWHDLWADTTEDEWIVPGFLPARRLVALFSPPKLGKSLLMLEIAVAVARGGKVLGNAVDRPRRVLYVDLENDPRGDVRARLKAMGYGPEDLDDLAYLSYPTLPALDTPMGGAVLLAAVEKFKAEVVVIDTISRVVRGEENDNDTWLQFYRHTGLLLKAAGVTTVRLDHTGKDVTRGMRGGSAKYGDVDVVWSMTADGDGFQLECTAHRLPVPEPVLLLRRNSLPRLHHEVVDLAEAMASGDADMIAWLDGHYGDAEFTWADAKKALRAAGYRFGSDRFAGLMEARARRPTTYVPEAYRDDPLV